MRPCRTIATTRGRICRLPSAIPRREYSPRAGVHAPTFRSDWLFSYQPTPGTVIFAGYGTGLEEPDLLRRRPAPPDRASATGSSPESVIFSACSPSGRAATVPDARPAHRVTRRRCSVPRSRLAWFTRPIRCHTSVASPALRPRGCSAPAHCPSLAVGARHRYHPWSWHSTSADTAAPPPAAGPARSAPGWAAHQRQLGHLDRQLRLRAAARPPAATSSSRAPGSTCAATATATATVDRAAVDAPDGLSPHAAADAPSR